VPILPAIFWRQ